MHVKKNINIFLINIIKLFPNKLIICATKYTNFYYLNKFKDFKNLFIFF